MENCNKYNSIVNEVKYMNIKKGIITLIIFVLIVIFIGNTVNAFSLPELTGIKTDTKEIEKVGNAVIQVLSVVGSILSVIVIVVLGIKYMLGSVEEKAEYKRTLIPFLIGAIFIFAESTIAGIVYQVAIKI